MIFKFLFVVQTIGTYELETYEIAKEMKTNSTWKLQYRAFLICTRKSSKLHP